MKLARNNCIHNSICLSRLSTPGRLSSSIRPPDKDIPSQWCSCPEICPHLNEKCHFQVTFRMCRVIVCLPSTEALHYDLTSSSNIHQDFVRHFHVLLPEGTGANQESIRRYLCRVDLAPEGFQVGRTMVWPTKLHYPCLIPLGWHALSFYGSLC